MIVRCPSCSSSRNLQTFNAVNGAELVDCPACGHAWIEGMALPVPEPRSIAPAGSAVIAEGSDAHLFLEAARGAQKDFGRRRRNRRIRLTAWATLATCAFSPLLIAAAYPEKVVTALPAMIRVYERMGTDVNVYGLEIRRVDLQHLIIDGREVIAVKGELANTSTSERKIPWLRFGLRAKDTTEVYHWTLDTEVRPLKPGESTSFVTRLASPPEAARNLEIRFARADEIGSNDDP